jgi:hypothetical protein
MDFDAQFEAQQRLTTARHCEDEWMKEYNFRFNQLCEDLVITGKVMENNALVCQYLRSLMHHPNAPLQTTIARYQADLAKGCVPFLHDLQDELQRQEERLASDFAFVHDLHRSEANFTEIASDIEQDEDAEDFENFDGDCDPKFEENEEKHVDASYEDDYSFDFVDDGDPAEIQGANEEDHVDGNDDFDNDVAPDLDEDEDHIEDVFDEDVERARRNKATAIKASDFQSSVRYAAASGAQSVPGHHTAYVNAIYTAPMTPPCTSFARSCDPNPSPATTVVTNVKDNR